MKTARTSPGRRARLLFAMLLVALGGLLARAGYIQVVRGDEFRTRAHRQHFQRVAVPAERGCILDRNGRALVSSYHSRSLAVDAKAAHEVAARNAKREKRPLGRWTVEWAAQYALAIGEPERTQEIAQRIDDAFSNHNRFRYLARWIDREVADRVEAAKLPGLIVLEEPRREYPHGRLAAAVLGMVGPDESGHPHGLNGLEAVCDKLLRGREGECAVQRSGRREQLHLYPELDSKPVAGRDLTTTLDIVVQRIVEEELDALEETYQPEMACAIAMDPRTGEILAIAGRPGLDPNAFPNVDRNALRIPAVHMSYEPGSTMKPLIAACALTHGVVGADQVFDCGPGYRKFGWRVVHDVRPKGDLDLAGVLIKSSNVGMAQVGLALGNRSTHEFLGAVGFGRKTGIALLGEEPGLVTDLAKWREHEHLISVSFGRAVMVTPLQMVTAIASLANGGYLVEPRILANRRRRAPRAIGYSSDALRFARETMVRTVDEGTGRRARVDGISIGGKTGTSELYPKGSQKYDSSFVAFAPADDPRLVVLVVARDPKKTRPLRSRTAALSQRLPSVGSSVAPFRPHCAIERRVYRVRGPANSAKRKTGACCGGPKVKRDGRRADLFGRRPEPGFSRRRSLSERPVNMTTRSPVLEQSQTLGQLAQAVGAALSIGADLPVTGVQEDSRFCESGDLFVAIRGNDDDGLRYARDAVERGAVAIAAERDPKAGVPWLRVADARAAAGFLADRVYGDPSRQLALIGVTGTNGKTTTAHVAAQLIPGRSGSSEPPASSGPDGATLRSPPSTRRPVRPPCGGTCARWSTRAASRA